MIHRSTTVLASLLAAILLVGCGSSAPPAASTSTGAQPWQDMKAKLDPMTPEQRAQYIKEHPEEFASLGQVNTPSPTPSTPSTP